MKIKFAMIVLLSISLLVSIGLVGGFENEQISFDMFMIYESISVFFICLSLCVLDNGVNE